MQQILLNEATGGDKRIPIYLVDATDGVTPETGVVPSGSELQYTQNGGTFTNFGGTWTEIGAGWYMYTPTSAECNQTGFLGLKLVKTGIRTFSGVVQIVTNDPYGNHVVTLLGGSIAAGSFATDAISATAVSAAAATKIAAAVMDEPMNTHTVANSLGEHFGNTIRGTVLADAGNTALTFKTSLSTPATSSLNRCLLLFVGGALKGQLSKITAFNGTTDFVTVQDAFTAAPATSDAFLIINS